MRRPRLTVCLRIRTSGRTVSGSVAEPTPAARARSWALRWTRSGMAKRPAAVILSGGPASVYAEGAPSIDAALFDAGVPAFGICYGFQAMAEALGGTVKRTEVAEFGRTTATVEPDAVLCAGQHGMRYALSHARVMVHQPSGGFQGQASDIERHAKEILDLRRRLNEFYVKHTRQPLSAIEDALERDTFLTAEGAREFGLVDQVIEKRPEIAGEK